MAHTPGELFSDFCLEEGGQVCFTAVKGAAAGAFGKPKDAALQDPARLIAKLNTLMPMPDNRREFEIGRDGAPVVVAAKPPIFAPRVAAAPHREERVIDYRKTAMQFAF